MVAMNIINLYENYNSYFNSDLKTIFKSLSKLAFENKYKIFLVGGLVRDLILNKESLDIDITVEGDAIKFAKILEKELGAQITSIHEDFGTIKIEINDQKIDFASTRSEIYPRAGHLPVITKIGCSLKEDVLRRDFTANSLAMSLNQENFCELVDYVGGFEDIKSKTIKILHDKSFIDDPTRIIRGLKYSTRLGFELDEHTRAIQDEYLDNVNYDMCYKRVKQELIKTFSSATQNTFEEFVSQGIYKLVKDCSLLHPHPEFLALVPRAEIHPSPLKWEGASKTSLSIENSIKKYKPKHPWIIYFGALFCRCELNHFSFTKYEKEVLEGAKSLLGQKADNDFELYKAFSTQKLETLLILAILGKEKEVAYFLEKLKDLKLQINGEDLIQAGFKPSKNFKEAFDYVLKTKMEKPNLSKVEELGLIHEFLNFRD